MGILTGCLWGCLYAEKVVSLGVSFGVFVIPASSSCKTKGPGKTPHIGGKTPQRHPKDTPLNLPFYGLFMPFGVALGGFV
jgi:hypothetical protein